MAVILESRTIEESTGARAVGASGRAAREVVVVVGEGGDTEIGEETGEKIVTVSGLLGGVTSDAEGEVVGEVAPGKTMMLGDVVVVERVATLRVDVEVDSEAGTVELVVSGAVETMGVELVGEVKAAKIEAAIEVGEAEEEDEELEESDEAEEDDEAKHGEVMPCATAWGVRVPIRGLRWGTGVRSVRPVCISFTWTTTGGALRFAVSMKPHTNDITFGQCELISIVSLRAPGMTAMLGRVSKRAKKAGVVRGLSLSPLINIIGAFKPAKPNEKKFGVCCTIKSTHASQERNCNPLRVNMLQSTSFTSLLAVPTPKLSRIEPQTCRRDNVLYFQPSQLRILHSLSVVVPLTTRPATFSGYRMANFIATNPPMA